MTKDEALRFALEALESSDKLINGDERKMGLCDALDGYYGFGSDIEKYNKQTNKVIKDIKEALAQLEHCSDCGQKLGDANYIHTCSPQQEANDEPVQWKMGASGIGGTGVIVQPQRTWVGLTNDEVNNFAAGCHLGNSVQGAIYKAEAKLKDKNNG